MFDHDFTAIERAEERVDSERGAALLRRLETAWIEQGYNARLAGLDRSDSETNWSHFHRYGWDLADAMICAQVDEVGTLDAMPLPMWDDMIAQSFGGAI